MIRRPISRQLAPKVVAGIKTTTIRDSAWPVGVPIQLYEWSGQAYRSPQIDVCQVMVDSVEKLTIIYSGFGHVWFMGSDGKYLEKDVLALTEGFDSVDDLDRWFNPTGKASDPVQKHMMRLRLLEGGAE